MSSKNYSTEENNGAKITSTPCKIEHSQNNESNQFNIFKAKSTNSNISWNKEVKVIKYNKYNQKLLSPPKPDDETGRIQGLKVAKKRF